MMLRSENVLKLACVYKLILLMKSFRSGLKFYPDSGILKEDLIDFGLYKTVFNSLRLKSRNLLF